VSALPNPSDFPRLSPELEEAARELVGSDEHGGRYYGQTQSAIDAGLSEATVESVRQGCYSDAQLSSLILKHRISAWLARCPTTGLVAGELAILLMEPSDELDVALAELVAAGEARTRESRGLTFYHPVTP
jgi:hypothetical protein